MTLIYFYNSKEEIESRIRRLKDKINKHNDFFFTYGWVREIEELKKKLKEVK